MADKNKNIKIPFFKTAYEVKCDNAQKLYKLIDEYDLPASSIRQQGEKVLLNLPFYSSGYFERICTQNGFNVKKLRDGDVVRMVKRLIHRPGLIIGMLAAVLLIIYLKNIVLRFDIIIEDETIRKDIMNVLHQENIKVGTYIPDIDLVVVERALKQRVSGISWAGITRKGNSLIIDVIENIPAVKGSQNRLPSNLVATENAVIDNVRVVDGQLKKAVGSGVCKGEIVVSGIVEKNRSKWVDGKEIVEKSVRYARSIAEIEGTFERTVVFEQKLDDIVKQKTGEIFKQRYFHLFSADIPLFFSAKVGSFYSSQKLSCIGLAGTQIPVGIRTLTLEEYDFKPVKYSQDQAYELAIKKSEKYETNFLKQYEIMDKKVKKLKGNDSVRIEITYKLHGNVCEQAEFFIKK